MRDRTRQHGTFPVPPGEVAKALHTVPLTRSGT